VQETTINNQTAADNDKMMMINDEEIENEQDQS